jgi:histidinol-phosphate aminotransferase
MLYLIYLNVMTYPRYTPLVSDLPSTVPFVGPESQERERKLLFDARLGANENMFGPSPKALSALKKYSNEQWMYGDPTSFELRCALAEKHKISTDNIVVGEGIDGLLGYLVRLLISEGDNVVTSDGAYPTFNYHVSGFGGKLHKVPYLADCEDIVSLIKKACSVDAKLIYFANPDNPMGTHVPGYKIIEALKDLPEGCLFILDEAYSEFAPASSLPSLEITDMRVVRLRTFSKAYGMAGARVGYAMAEENLINSFEKIRNHFGMNRLAQKAALEALSDNQWLLEMVQKVENGRQRIYKIAASNNLKSITSSTNFVAIDCGKDGKFAKKVLTELISLGIFVRMPFVSPQDRCIRVSVGKKRDLDRFEKALPTALKRASK